MKTLKTAKIFLIFIFLPIAANGYRDFVSNELIVQLSNNIAITPQTLDLIDKPNSVTPVFPHIAKPEINRDLKRIFLLRYGSYIDLKQIADDLSQDPQIEKVTYNFIRPTLQNENENEKLTDDPESDRQWNLSAIEIIDAWQIEKGNENVVIGVVDTGAFFDHPDLIDQLWENENEIADNGIDDDQNGYVDDRIGWDFIDSDNDPSDPTGHGTHVIGILAAGVNNGIGIAGIANRCRVMVIRAGASIDGGGTGLKDSDSAAAIIYAVDNGARVINMSWGGVRQSFVIEAAIRYAHARGVLLIAAAGNDMNASVIFPAANSEVMAVGSIGEDGTRFYQSNFGSGLEIVAPGSGILSTHINGKYRVLSGTSMASPHVASVAALMIAKRPNLTHDEMRNILIQTADQIAESPELINAGKLNAVSALTASSSLIAKITDPKTNIGIDDRIEILGSAGGFKFRSWQLFYGKTTEPTDWKPITKPHDQPRYNRKLATWETTEIDEGIYTLRLKIFTSDNKMLTDDVIIYVDHTPPKIENFQISTWLIGPEQSNIAKWSTDDMTTDAIQIRGEIEPNRESFVTNEHLFGLPSDQIEFSIISRNVTNLVTTDNNNSNFYFVDPISPIINTNSLKSRHALQPKMIFAKNWADFDHDGILEFVGLSIDEKKVRIVEGNRVEHVIPIDFTPIEIGDVNRNGKLEILGNDGDRIFLIEAEDVYPSKIIWETNLIENARLIDFDNDREIEIIGSNNYTGQILIFENFDQIAEITNQSEGINVVKSFAFADLDGNGKIEICFADSEGDLFVYEAIGDNQLDLKATAKIAIEDATEIAVGDLNGDGISDLIVGGMAFEPHLPSLPQRWFFQSLTLKSGKFQKLWHKEILPYRRKGNNISIIDLDGDDKSEVIFAVSPNFYVFDGDGTPLGFSQISNTDQLLIDPKTKEIFVNADHNIMILNFNRSENNTESLKPIEPKKPPKLLAIEFIENDQISVTFETSAIGDAKFEIRTPHHDLIEPKSIIFDKRRTRAILTFPRGKLKIDQIYDLTVFDQNRSFTISNSEKVFNNLEKIIVFPNPIRPNDFHKGVVYFNGIPSETVIDLYDANGDHVQKLIATSSYRGRIAWYLDSKNGREVSGGIYIYAIEKDGDRKTGKIAVIK